MTRLRWLPSFELGVEEIDAEHRRIFDIVIEIQQSIEIGALDRCARLVIEFIKMIERHFEEEEAFLARVGYPDVRGHAKVHDALLDRAKELKQVCDGVIEAGKIERCFEETVRLLLDDIVKGDSEFKSFLQERGLSSP